MQKILREKGVRFAAEVGRNDLKLHGKRVTPKEIAASDSGEFDAIATLSRVHDDAAETVALDEAQRAHLDAVLTELLSLKSRLSTARRHMGG